MPLGLIGRPGLNVLQLVVVEWLCEPVNASEVTSARESAMNRKLATQTHVLAGCPGTNGHHALQAVAAVPKEESANAKVI